MKFFPLALAALTLLIATDAEAGRKKKRHKRGRGCGSVPSELSGGKAAQSRDNRGADADDLTRLENRKDLESFIAAGRLVEVGSTRSYYLDTIGGHDPGHEDLYRYARPWTKLFLDVEMKSLHDEFGLRAKVTSLVRTDKYQDRICRSGNGAAICGGDWWEQSLHITGATVDISKEGMTCPAKKKFRKRLIALQAKGQIGAIEEYGAFHVFVRKAYGKAVKKAGKPKKAKKPRKAKKKKRKRGRHGRTR